MKKERFGFYQEMILNDKELKGVICFMDLTTLYYSVHKNSFINYCDNNCINPSDYSFIMKDEKSFQQLNNSLNDTKIIYLNKDNLLNLTINIPSNKSYIIGMDLEYFRKSREVIEKHKKEIFDIELKKLEYDKILNFFVKENIVSQSLIDENRKNKINDYNTIINIISHFKIDNKNKDLINVKSSFSRYDLKIPEKFFDYHYEKLNDKITELISNKELKKIETKKIIFSLLNFKKVKNLNFYQDNLFEKYNSYKKYFKSLNLKDNDLAKVIQEGFNYKRNNYEEIEKQLSLFESESFFDILIDRVFSSISDAEKVYFKKIFIKYAEINKDIADYYKVVESFLKPITKEIIFFNISLVEGYQKYNPDNIKKGVTFLLENFFEGVSINYEKEKYQLKIEIDKAKCPNFNEDFNEFKNLVLNEDYISHPEPSKKWREYQLSSVIVENSNIKNNKNKI